MPSKRLAALVRDGGEQPVLQYSPMCSVWAFTAYDACDMRCSYCASYAQGPSAPLVSADGVRELLGRELPLVPRSDLIGIGPIIDAYAHAEADHGVTRAALEVLVADDREVVIVTKGTVVLRDVDLLAHNDKARVCVSVPSFDQGVLDRIEPAATTVEERLATIEALHEAGVTVQLHVQPWIPKMTDVEAMVAWADGRFDTWVAPLNVQNPVVARGGWGKRFTQQQVNEAYVRAMRRLGPQPRVTWARPVWLGDDLWAQAGWGPAAGACPTGRDELRGPSDAAVPAAAAVDGEGVAARDLRTTQRILAAMAHDRLGMIGMEVLSAHLRCYSGQYPQRAITGEGPSALSQFWALQAVMEDRDMGEPELTVDGPLVRSTATVTGTLTQDQEALDLQAGQRIAVDVDGAYRYDDHGLLIEQWLDIAAVRAVEPVEPASVGG